MTEQTLTVHQSPHLMPAMTMADVAERFKALTNFTRSIMRDGTDYGTVPGTDKPTLLKPGAEKLTTFFGLTVRYELIEKVEDWTGIEHSGEAFFYYWFRCQLSRGDLLIAEADGSCNSWEAKYRYRQAQRKCPNCEQSMIKRSRFPPRGNPQGTPGWYCYAKIGGCGANFAHDDSSIVDQEVGRIPNPNPADIVNTIKKMGQKRALVAATLLAVNASEFFTQDLEDLAPLTINGETGEVISNGPDWEKTPGQDTEPEPTPEPEAQPEPEPVPAPESDEAPRRRKGAVIFTKHWKPETDKLAAEIPYYQDKDGKPNSFHMKRAAEKLGHVEITDYTLPEVIADLRQYALDAEALKQGEIELE